MTETAEAWPSLPFAAWRDTRATLHLWTQIVGKIRLAQAPLVNPYAAQRLANGNTRVADNSGVQEFDSTGKEVVWRHRQPQVTGLSSF